jgi:hypothetical protein
VAAEAWRWFLTASVRTGELTSSVNGDKRRVASAIAASHPRLLAGVYAALTAEAVFMTAVAAMASLRGGDPWKVVRVPASFLIGPDATRPQGFVPGDVLLGLLMHLFFGALVGVLYARLLQRLRLSPLTGGVLAGGILYGFGFWLLPALFPAWLEPFRLPLAGKALQAVAHVVYGVVLGLVFVRLTRR